MFIVDISLKNTPVGLSVQRKTREGAEEVYGQILGAMRSQGHQVMELTCEKQEDKKIAFVAIDVVAVQLTEKAGASTSSGKPPGFLAMAE